MLQNYRVENIICSKKESNPTIIEVAAPLNLTKIAFDEILTKMLDKRPLFFIQCDLKKRGEKDTASNLRFKKDKDTNNLVVENFVSLFERIDKRNKITITSYPRSERYYSASIDASGIISMNDSRGGKHVDSEFTLLFQDFLRKYNVNLINYREACSGAKYNTYLADMISFILAIQSFIRPAMFEEKYMEVDVGLNDIEDVPEKNKAEWKAKKDFKYLYFKDCKEEKETSIRFNVPISGKIDVVYDMMKEILTMKENNSKKTLRETLINSFTYDRFSDYWFNDIDDALSILMIYHCFNYGEETKESNEIKQNLSLVIQNIF